MNNSAGRRDMESDLNKFGEVLNHLDPIGEEPDDYGMMPVEPNYQTG